jgi:CHAT domain-containing protein/tetratricopeptide (TPR) repeat protein
VDVVDSSAGFSEPQGNDDARTDPPAEVVAVAAKAFEAGKDLIGQGDYRQAAELLESVVRLFPAEASAQCLLGVSRFNDGDEAAALMPFATCVYLEPDHKDARTGLGMTLRALGCTEQAPVHLAHAAHLGHPQAPAVLAEMGMDFCRKCGAPRNRPDPAATSLSAGPCQRCTGKPLEMTPPSRRTWSWAHLPEEDYRSRITLPGSRLFDLGTAYLTRYRDGGGADDIDQAITYLELAAATAPDSTVPKHLSQLATAYRQRFECHGLPADLDYAIECREQALALASRDDPVRVIILSSLGLAYSVRYQVSGAGSDLDRAVALTERALKESPASEDDRTSAMANAAMIYRLRYRCTHAPEDLDRSIELHEQTLRATRADHPRSPGRLINFSVALADRYRRDRYRRDKASDDLDQAIDIAERAVTATPREDHNRPSRLHNLGLVRLERYEARGLRPDLEGGIEALRQAEAAIPDGSPSVAHVVSSLANACLMSGAVRQSIGKPMLPALVRRLASADGSPPPDRVLAGTTVGTLANALGEHATAGSVLNAAIGLLPAVVRRDATWSDRERLLGAHLGLVSQAIAAYCAMNDPAGAVEVAESGRGLQLAAELDMSSELTDLDLRLPELAEAFGQVRGRLSTTSADPGGNLAPLWTRYEDLVSRIRDNPGFSDFLRPPKLADLQHAAAGGTVIMVNSARDRSDAILVSLDRDPVHIPLDSLAADDVVANAKAFLAAVQDPGSLAGSQDLLSGILGWLWETIGRPVSRKIPSDGRPQRVWWMPTGLLGLFPLHAAGHPGQPGALDAFISSYTPTLRVLAHARTRPPATARRQLTIALAHTAGLPDLPGTIAEALNLNRTCGGAPPLLDQEATIGRVRTSLPDATWVHFACHARADYSAPSNGGLRLYDGLLTIPEISRCHLGSAELAYLSACSTAHRSWDHIDESVNVASVFHLAGFRHVIASLWPLNDGVAPEASRSFYRSLQQGPSASSAAQALHQVTHELRTKYSDRPDLWASLIHSGP